MLATIDANKFIKALNAYNKSLKSPLHHTTNITTNHDLVIDLFNQDMLNALFQDKKGNKNDNYGQEFSNKDVVRLVQFFNDQNQPDKLLSGLNYQIKQQQPHYNNTAFIIDLTRAFKQKFVVGKIIGQGAYASVRIAINKQTNKKVALKIYQKQRICRAERKRSILRQIRILSTMNHKNIVKILDVIQTNNHLNIVMEYLSGTPLSCFLKKQQNKKLSQMQCKAVIAGLAQALVHMKGYNISHRDIKIQNVILDDQLHPKLIDFGFSTCVQIGKKVPLFCGTPNYMAPEIVLRKAFCGLKSDIWALGVLFFVIATGVYPFKGSTDQELYKKITNLQFPSYLLDSNYKMAELMKLMLKFNPDQRITPQQILNHPWLNQQNKYYISNAKNWKKQTPAVSPTCKKKQRISTTMTALSNYKQNTQTKTPSKSKIKSAVPKQQKRVGKFRQSLNNTLKPRNCNEKTRSSTSKSFINNNKGSKQISKSKVYQKISCQKSWKKLKQEGCRKLERSKSRSRLT